MSQPHLKTVHDGVDMEKLAKGERYRTIGMSLIIVGFSSWALMFVLTALHEHIANAGGWIFLLFVLGMFFPPIGKILRNGGGDDGPGNPYG